LDFKGFGFRVFRVWVRVKELGFLVSFRVSSLGLRAQGLVLQVRGLQF